MQIEFEVQGKVKAKQSVKFANMGGFMKKYPEWNVNNFKDKQLTCEIDIDILIPKSFSKKKQDLAAGGFIRPTVKPDCDNIAKNIDDAMNGIVFPDDKQIVTLVIRKWYSNSEKVKITVSEI